MGFAESVAAGAFAGGTLLDIVGGSQARSAQASAQRKAAYAEADFLEDQAIQVTLSGYRERFVRGTQGQEVIGAQTSAFAANGVDIAGSALAQLASSKAQLEQELNAMSFDTKFRAAQIRKRAAAYRSGAGQGAPGGGLQDLATLVGGGAQIASIFIK